MLPAEGTFQFLQLVLIMQFWIKLLVCPVSCVRALWSCQYDISMVW